MLSAVICRIRDPDGSVPLVVAYDHHEKTWNPPMPLLFQRRVGLENRADPDLRHPRPLAGALAAAGITGIDGKPLDFAPHDFRRIFATEAIMNGMPPHIAQLILGHRDINTTMGYKAVYPEEAISGHRAFIARRRAAAAQRGIPHPDRRGMGGVPRPLRAPQARPRRLRPGIRVELASMSTAASDAPS